MLSDSTSYWALEETRVDALVFFRALPRHLPEATSLFIEGSCIAENVKKVLLSHAQTGLYLPDPEPYEPYPGSLRRDFFRCTFSPTLLSELEHLAEHHAEPELCDHLFVYVNNAPILEFYDFPHNEIWLPITVSEDRVRAIASALNMAYRKSENEDA